MVDLPFQIAFGDLLVTVDEIEDDVYEWQILSRGSLLRHGSSHSVCSAISVVFNVLDMENY